MPSALTFSDWTKIRHRKPRLFPLRGGGGVRYLEILRRGTNRKTKPSATCFQQSRTVWVWRQTYQSTERECGSMLEQPNRNASATATINQRTAAPDQAHRTNRSAAEIPTVAPDPASASPGPLTDALASAAQAEDAAASHLSTKRRASSIT